MTIRIAAIEVSHWHAVYDAAYLRHLVAMPDVELVAVQDTDAGLVAKRAAEVGNPATFTDYRQMLTSVRPDFVVALGRHCQMAGIAHDLLEQGYPFLMEKPMGINAAEVEAVAAKAERLNAFVAVPLAQRYGPFAARARELLAAGRFGPLSHIYVRINRPGPARYPAWDCAWMLAPAEAGGGCLRNLGSHGLDMFLHLTGETAQVTGAQLSRRAHERAVEDYASVMLRSGLGLQPNAIPSVWGCTGRAMEAPRSFGPVRSIRASDASSACRANAALNVLHIGGAFAIQAGIGVIVGLWPRDPYGHYPPDAFAAAFLIIILLQFMALLWFLGPRWRTRQNWLTGSRLINP